MKSIGVDILGVNVRDFKSAMGLTCSLYEKAEKSRFLPKINVTKTVLTPLLEKSDLAELALGEVFDLMDIGLDNCIDDDCLNPCDGEVGACLTCFTGLIYDTQYVSQCNQCAAQFLN